MAEVEPPRHADDQLDQAGLRAALLLEQALASLTSEQLRVRFASLHLHAAGLRDASGIALRKSAVTTRAALGPGDGLADYVEHHLATELREAIDEVLRILNRRAAHRARPSLRNDA
jgi:hypothetical protein